MIRQAAWLLSVFGQHKDGSSPYAVVYGHEYQHAIFEFGESVIWRDPAGWPLWAKLESRFGLGIWVGRAGRSGEHLLLTPKGTIKARAVKRRPANKHWDESILREARGLPWAAKAGVTDEEQAGRIAESFVRQVIGPRRNR